MSKSLSFAVVQNLFFISLYSAVKRGGEALEAAQKRSTKNKKKSCRKRDDGTGRCAVSVECMDAGRVSISLALSRDALPKCVQTSSAEIDLRKGPGFIELGGVSLIREHTGSFVADEGHTKRRQFVQ